MSEAEKVGASTTPPSEDWPSKATQTVVGYVDTVRGATTGKALVASRAVVYFLALGLISVVLVILALVMLLRLMVSLTAWLPFISDGESWLAYLTLGVLFVALGAILWKKKDA